MIKIKFNKLIEDILPLKKISLDRRALRNAGVGVLVLDERWDRLFTSVKKPPAIVKAEQIIRNCLDEKIRLQMESKLNNAEKQVKLNRIIELTEALNNNSSESARAEIEECGTKTREINERELQIEQRYDELDREIAAKNSALLEDAVLYLYRYMKKSRSRITELDAQIEDMRDNIKARIDERVSLDESVNETYNFLHGLLGAKQTESLDIHYTLD